MPINIPDNLPSRWMIESESIFVMNRSSALRQDLRAVRLAVVLPDQDRSSARRLVRLIAKTPLQVELTLIGLGPDTAKAAHLPRAEGSSQVGDGLPACVPFDAVVNQSFDAVLVGHAPYHGLLWHEAPCWDELRDLIDWSDERVRARLFMGWSAQAALQHIYGLSSYTLEKPLCGVFGARMTRAYSYLMRGFDETFAVPIDASSVVDAEALSGMPGLKVLAQTPESGPYLMRNANRRDVFVLGQPDMEPAGADAQMGQQWRSHASLLFLNWMNYYVYQPTSQQVDTVLGAAR